MHADKSQNQTRILQPSDFYQNRARDFLIFSNLATEVFKRFRMFIFERCEKYVLKKLGELLNCLR